MADIHSQGVSAPGANVNWFRFHGTGAEYFGIWITNILLTIVTIGIYSAWAKVRRNRYFYGNLELMGARFDYHARGGQILKGRLIVFGCLFVMNIMTNIYPLFSLITSLVILTALPFLVAKGIRFSTRVTSYRNVRFNFVGTAGGAFKAFILGPFLTFLTLGLLAPISTRWFARYFFNNLRYGDRPFASEPQLGRLYKALILPIIILVIGLSVFGFTAFGLFRQYQEIGGNPDADQSSMVQLMGEIIIVSYVTTILTLALSSLFYRAMSRIIILSATVFDGKHPLSSDMSAFRYIWVSISNVIVSLLTLGLARPWAACRYMRLVSDTTAITIHGDIGTVLTDLEATGSVASAEFMDLEGVDFGF